MKPYRAPLVLLALAVALFCSPVVLAFFRNANPLVLPISLEPGVTVSPAFRVSHPVRYLVELEVDRALPFDELRCLLGEPLPSAPCDENQQVVHLGWRVSSEGAEVAKGTSAYNQGAGYGPTIEKMVGAFEGHPGQDYKLEITVFQSMRALEAARPRVLVRMHPQEWTGDYMLSVLLQLLALILAAASGVWLFAVWYRTFAAKRRTVTQSNALDLL